MSKRRPRHGSSSQETDSEMCVQGMLDVYWGVFSGEAGRTGQGEKLTWTVMTGTQPGELESQVALQVAQIKAREHVAPLQPAHEYKLCPGASLSLLWLRGLPGKGRSYEWSEANIPSSRGNSTLILEGVWAAACSILHEPAADGDHGRPLPRAILPLRQRVWAPSK